MPSGRPCAQGEKTSARGKNPRETSTFTNRLLCLITLSSQPRACPALLFFLPPPTFCLLVDESILRLIHRTPLRPARQALIPPLPPSSGAPRSTSDNPAVFFRTLFHPPLGAGAKLISRPFPLQKPPVWPRFFDPFASRFSVCFAGRRAPIPAVNFSIAPLPRFSFPAPALHVGKTKNKTQTKTSSSPAEPPNANRNAQRYFFVRPPPRNCNRDTSSPVAETAHKKISTAVAQKRIDTIRAN